LFWEQNNGTTMNCSTRNRSTRIKPYSWYHVNNNIGFHKRQLEVPIIIE